MLGRYYLVLGVNFENKYLKLFFKIYFHFDILIKIIFKKIKKLF